MPKVRLNVDLEPHLKEYADDKEVKKHLGANSRNELIAKALKQYDPNKNEESPYYVAWKQKN